MRSPHLESPPQLLSKAPALLRGKLLKNRCQTQRYEDAIDSYDKVIEFNPLDAEAWGNRGGVLSMLQRYEDAIASFDKAIQIQPNFPLAIYSREQALSQLG